jgi:hypothetical protein
VLSKHWVLLWKSHFYSLGHTWKKVFLEKWEYIYIYIYASFEEIFTTWILQPILDNKELEMMWKRPVLRTHAFFWKTGAISEKPCLVSCATGLSEYKRGILPSARQSSLEYRNNVHKCIRINNSHIPLAVKKMSSNFMDIWISCHELRTLSGYSEWNWNPENVYMTIEFCYTLPGASLFCLHSE